MLPIACSVPKFGDLSWVVPKFVVELILVSAGLAIFLTSVSPLMFKRAKAVQIKFFPALGWATFAFFVASLFIKLCGDSSEFAARSMIYPAVICFTTCFAKVEKLTFAVSLVLTLAAAVALQ